MRAELVLTSDSCCALNGRLAAWCLGPASVGLLSGLLCPGAQAIMVFKTSDITYNTTAPGGSLTGSGWQYEGTWGSFLGTAIAPNYFVTATHVGGTTGDTFIYNGSSYTTTAHFSSPASDLTVWQVSGAFPTYAPLYSGSDEAGRGLLVIGRGPARSDSVVFNDRSEAVGWEIGTGRGTVRWGENVVASAPSLTGLGRMLLATFDRTGGDNEAMLAGGDSGGGVFVQEGGIWKLAGINYGINGPFNTSASDTGSFFGALYNTDGLYENVGSGWDYVEHDGSDTPAYWVATSISANKSWLDSVAPVPEPHAWAGATGGFLAVFAFVRRHIRLRAEERTAADGRRIGLAGGQV